MTEHSSSEEKPSNERRKNIRIPIHIQLELSVHQFQQEGEFQGQQIEGHLADISKSGLQFSSAVPLAQDMFVVIRLPEASGVPPLTARIIRVEVMEDEYYYGCMLTGVDPQTERTFAGYIESVIPKK